MHTAQPIQPNSDSTNRLTCTESIRSILGVPRVTDILRGLVQQFSSDSAELEKILDEMNELRPAFQRYRDLAEQMKAKEERARVAMGLIADATPEDGVGIQEYIKGHQKLVATARASGVELEYDAPKFGVQKAGLWKLIREVVRQVLEIQVVELERVLEALGVKTTRQAIESALSAHPKTFRTIKRGREKYVALK